jgi:hypothetical protein
MINEMLDLRRAWETDRKWEDDFCSDAIFPKTSNEVQYVIAYDGVWAYGPRYDYVEEFITYHTLDAALAELPRAKEFLIKHGVTEIGIVELSPKGRRWVMHLRDLTFDTPTNAARL